MRRGLILIFGLLLASAAMPTTSADARPLLLKILRAGPLGPVFGARPHVSQRAYQSRRAASRAARTRAAARAPAPAAAVVGTVAGATAATAAKASNSRDIRSTAETAKPEANKPAEATASDASGAQSTAAATTGSAPSADPVPLPTAAPAQRNALANPDDEPEGRSFGEPVRAPGRTQTRLGTVGPLAWPSAYEDVIGFTLWPKEYGERLRAHGIGDIVGTALLPSTMLDTRTRAASVQARADAPNVTPVAAGCGSVDLTLSDWPIAQIAGAIELDAAQRGTLEQLRTALSDAISSIKSTCRGDETNLSPVDRLHLMQNTLWAVHDSTQLVRGPLAKFYDSLTAEQKQQFAAPAAPQADPRARNAMSRADMARMCGSPASSEAPMRQLEQSLRPTKAQRASLNVLQKTSFEMGQFLMASCLKPIPETPVERLDAAADRLTAVIFATSNVNIALNDFTSQLGDEQKAKLNPLR